MTPKAYITKLASFLPNDPVSNDRMEEILGKVNGAASRARRIVLKNNGIRSRHYAVDPASGRLTHTNAALCAEAVRGLLSPAFTLQDIELLCCATSVPDQIMPSHASMVQGCLGCPETEILSAAGVCGSGMQAMKHGLLSLWSGNSSNAVCVASELVSPMFMAHHFDAEISTLAKLESRPILAFEKDFLRWMLSDGAGAALLQTEPPAGGKDLCLRIDWLDTVSFAGQIDACMYAGAEKNADGRLEGWKVLTPATWLDQSIFAIKQDIALLEKHIVRLGTLKLAEALARHDLAAADIDFFLPHLSSEYFRAPFEQEMKTRDVHIPQERWFTNLSRVGNIGSASFYVMLEELFHSGRLDRGMKVLGLIPESSRFSYAYILLTVC